MCDIIPFTAVLVYAIGSRAEICIFIQSTFKYMFLIFCSPPDTHECFLFHSVSYA